MIVRVWRGQTSIENAPVYFKHVTEKIFPRVGMMDGARGSYIIQREVDGKVEFLAFTLWEGMEAIKQFAGENIEEAKIEPEARAVLVDFDEFVRHYEITYDSISGV